MRHLIFRYISALLLHTALEISAAPVESFEKFSVGELTRYKTAEGRWAADKGHAAIHLGNSRNGKQSLRIMAGSNRQVQLHLAKPAAASTLLTFWAERWTKRAPFEFRIHAKSGSGWKQIYMGDRAIKVGGFHTQVEVNLPANTTVLRFTSATPKGSGVLIDDVSIAPAKPMKVTHVTTEQPVIPALIRKKNNPVIALKITTEGRLSPKSLTRVKLNLEGTTQLKDIKSLQLIQHTGKGQPSEGTAFAAASPAPTTFPGSFSFSGNAELKSGENYFWLCVELNDNASLDREIDASILEIAIDGKVAFTPSPLSPKGGQRIGYAVRQRGDDGSKAFRIPGLATTNKGTLIGVYDVRYRTGGDLPGDIDVGMSRSTDGGQTWEKMKVIMDMGNDPKWRYDGIGDPAVLVDKSNNRIWVGATWSHGNRSWRGSGQGMKPEETGQVMLVYSDDDGLTWSKPINITSQVKTNPDWHFVLHGPGAGITMKDGTLVFPAQYQDESKHPDGRKKAYPFSTIMWSKDNGKTWKLGTGIKGNTTEAQVVELADGSLMLNCRDNRGGSRTIGITKDLGKTWTMHPTDRKALQDPVCMASLLRVDHHKHGTLFIFSNPNTKRGRHNMTIKVSKDEGMTWPEKFHSLYDSRNGSGYSCLAPVGKDHVGVYYEGPHEIYYLRFKIEDLLK